MTAPPDLAEERGKVAFPLTRREDGRILSPDLVGTQLLQEHKPREHIAKFLSSDE